jgi:hypothetical protein
MQSRRFEEWTRRAGVPELSQALHHPNRAIRTAAALQLASRGEQALPALPALLRRTFADALESRRQAERRHARERECAWLCDWLLRLLGREMGDLPDPMSS